MAFPTTGVIDNFNRANEGPPPSAAWSGDADFNDGGAGMNVTTNQCAPADTSYNSAYRNGGTFGPNSESYATVATKPGATYRFYFLLRLQAPATSGADGYSAQTTIVSGAGNDTNVIFRIDNATKTQLGATATAEATAGHVYGIEAIGSTLTYYDNGAAILSRTDATYGSAGYIGLGGRQNTRLDNFGGGTISEGASYTETGFSVFGLVSSGAEVETMAGAGASVFGEVGAGADIETMAGAGAAVCGEVGAGTDVEMMAGTGAAVFGEVGSGADVQAAAETGASVWGEIGAGADAQATASVGAAIWSGDSAGEDVQAVAEVGASVYDWQASGADIAGLVESGFSVWDVVGSGAETYTPAGGGASYVETGFAVWGMEASGVDVGAFLDSGFAVVGVESAGADIGGGIDTGASIAGWIAAGLDVLAMIDAGFSVWDVIASGIEAYSTPAAIAGGPALYPETVRAQGQIVAQTTQTTREKGRLVR